MRDIMQNPIRKTFIDSITEYLLDTGKNIANLASPTSILKASLDNIENKNEEEFINSVLSNLVNIDIQSLDAVRSLNRLYKSLLVISKATTQEKIDRFIELTVNGIIAQEQLSDEDYELFVNIVDELTDQEFLILHTINKFELPHIGETINNPLSNQISEQLIASLNMDEDLFKSYVSRLKAKGLILSIPGGFISHNTPFFINIVDGNISVLYKKLIEFLEKEY